MLRHILNLSIVLGYATASLFGGLQDAKHAVKYNFSNGINSSPKLNVVLDLPQDNVFNSIDHLVKKELMYKFGETLDDIVEQLIQVGYESMRFADEVKLLVDEIFQKFESLSNESNDILLNESESREQSYNKVQEFFQLLRVEIVGYSRYEFENIYSFESIDKSIRDKAYNVTKEIKNRLDQLDHKARQKSDYFMQIYESSQEQLKLRQVLEKFAEEFIDHLDVNSVVKLVNEVNDVNHPLVNVIIETVKHRDVIINKLLEHSGDENYYNDDPTKSAEIKTICEILDMIARHEKDEKIQQFIEKQVPERLRNKFIYALKSGGSSALKYVVIPICETTSYFMALVFFELTDTLFPVLNESDYEFQERIFLFIEWLKFVVQNGIEYSDKNLNSLQDSAQKLIKNLKEHNLKVLADALELFEPFRKQFQGLFEDIEKQLKKVIKS